MISFLCFLFSGIYGTKAQKYNTTPTTAICAIRMAGRPYLNLTCSVLWCQAFMPNSAPMLPPAAAHQSKVDSSIRHLDRLAFHLSMPYKKNVTILIAPQ